MNKMRTQLITLSLLLLSLTALSQPGSVPG